MRTDSDLASFTVSLPRSQKDYLRRQAVAAGCSTPSEYVRRLIYADQQVRAKEALEAKLLSALESPARTMTPKAWEELKEQVRSRVSAKRSRKPGRKRE